MTPKEKAIELVDQFMEHTVEWDNVTEYAFDSEYHAKQCAVIAVNELIDFAKLTDATNGWDHLNYWNEVKQEINKL
jgi:hypothetical protein